MFLYYYLEKRKKFIYLFSCKAFFREFNPYFGCLKEKEFENFSRKEKKGLLYLTQSQKMVFDYEKEKVEKMIKYAEEKLLNH